LTSYTETGTVDAEFFQPFGQLRRHISGIEFDRVFEAVFEQETVAQYLHDRGKSFDAEDARRAAAPMQPGDPNRPRHCVGNQHDLALERYSIGRDDIVTPRLLGVAAAIKA